MKQTLRSAVLVSSALVVFTLSAHAQLRLGVKGGGNLTDMTTTSIVLDQVDPLLNAHLGIMMQYSPLGQAFKQIDLTKPVLKKKTFWSDFAWGLAVQPECLFTTKGGRLWDASDAFLSNMGLNDDGYAFRTYNLEVPVHLQAGIRYKNTLYTAQFAPYVGFLLSGSLNGDNHDFKTIDGNFPFNRMEIGYGYGIGLQSGPWQLSLNARLTTSQVGKEKLYPLTGVNYNPFHRMNHRNLTLSLGYFF